MELFLIDSENELVQYKGIWEEILFENENNNLYLTPDWIISWWKFFGESHEMFIIMVKKENEIAGFFPFMITKKKYYKEINFLGYGRAAYMEFILIKKFSHEAISSVVTFINTYKKGYLLNLHGFREDSENLEYLKKCIILYNMKYYTSRIESYRINLFNTNFNDYYKSRFKHDSVKMIDKIEKKMSPYGTFEWKSIEGDSIEDVFQLHDKRWLKKNDGNGFSKGRAKEFFKFIALDQRLLTFEVYVRGLYINERIIGLAYGFEYNGKFLFYRIAHDNDFSAFAPGKLVVKNILRECFEKGLREFDFSTGYERYKAEWTDEMVYINKIVSATPNVKYQLIYRISRVKELFRLLLKKNKRIVYFKKNTFGLLKYAISKKNISSRYNKIYTRLKNIGIRDISGVMWRKLTKTLQGELHELYSKNLQKVLSDYSSYNIKIRYADFRDADMLSVLMNVELSDIVRRFYKGHECFIAEYEDEVIGYTWVDYKEICIHNIKYKNLAGQKSACIYDLSVNGKKKINETMPCLILFLINYLKKKNCISFYLLINNENGQKILDPKTLGFNFDCTLKASRRALSKKYNIEEVRGKNS